MIKLTDLLKEEKAFTATNKETGNVSVFKTKAARDAAVKSGSHEKRKSDKDDAVDVPTGEKKPNMFSKDTGYDAGDKKSEPKSDTPKLDFDKRGNMSFDSMVGVRDYLNKELGVDGDTDINDLGAIQYFIDGSTDTIYIGEDEIDGKPFSVSLTDEDGNDNDTYKSFDNQEDAMAYAKELAQKLKSSAKPTNTKSAEPKEPKKSEPVKSKPKYDSEYFADDEKSDSSPMGGYDDDDDDYYYDDEDDGLAGYKKTVERLDKVETALGDELKLRDNGFSTARSSGGGGGYWEGPLTISSDDVPYEDERFVELSIGSGMNDGNFSIGFTDADGMEVFDGGYSITGDRELSAEEAFKLGKVLMKNPDVQKFLKGQISKEEFKIIYDKLASKFGKSTKNETTMKLKNLLPINEGQHKKFERQLKNLQKIIKIDLSEALEVLEEDGVLESIDHLEIAVERLQGMIKDLKRIR